MQSGHWAQKYSACLDGFPTPCYWQGRFTEWARKQPFYPGKTATDLSHLQVVYLHDSPTSPCLALSSSSSRNSHLLSKAPISLCSLERTHPSKDPCGDAVSPTSASHSPSPMSPAQQWKGGFLPRCDWHMDMPCHHTTWCLLSHLLDRKAFHPALKQSAVFEEHMYWTRTHRTVLHLPEHCCPFSLSISGDCPDFTWSSHMPVAPAGEEQPSWLAQENGISF